MKTTIQEARVKKGFTQSQLAVYANVAISTISPIEQGKACTMRVFMDICKVLEVDPKDIVGVTIKKRTGRTGWSVVEDPFLVSAE